MSSNPPPPPDPRNVKPQVRAEYYSRDMGQRIATAVSEAVRASFDNAEGSYQSCMNCIHFNEASEVCGVYGARPPARIIAYSCGTAYEDNKDIPF